jgi:prepilin-type N-terminal cleavage/methylation domain-containing protein
MTSPTVSSRRAFTLIELLVVISILAILMTLLFPAVGRAFEQVKKTQAKNDATQIATAITSYYSEYGKMPLAGTADTQINDTGGQFVNLLSGQNINNENPRQIVFLEVPRAKSGKNGAESAGGNYTSAFKDSWGQPYQVWVDGDYDNVIKGPDGTDIRKTVLVWSTGKPNGKALNTEQKNFIKSWE